jgi:hypothetical protein
MEEKESLFAEHLKVSKKEDDAKKKRLEIEAEIEALFPFTDALSKTFKEEKYKVTIKKNPVMKLDNKLYIPIRESIPEELRPEKVKYDLDSKGFKWLKENNPEIYKKVSDCVEAKDNKSTITVEKI